MMYKGLVSNGYIIGFVALPDGVLTDEDVQIILSSKPDAPEGHEYMLREDYTWEIYEIEDTESV